MLAVFPRQNPKYDQTDSEESDTVEQPFPPAPKPPTFSTKVGMCKMFFLGPWFINGIIIIYIYAFSRRFYPKRLPRESFTKEHRSLIITR